MYTEVLVFAAVTQVIENKNTEVNGEHKRNVPSFINNFLCLKLSGIFLPTWTFPALNMEQKLC